MLKLNAVSKVYRTDEVETTALHDINLEIADGEFTAIMGPSGCGKSTLLNILGTLDRPTSGEFWIGGQDVARHSERQLARVRRKHIGFIFQSFNLLEELSVRENVELSLLYRGVSSGERRRKVAAVLERMGIAHRADHRPSQLSGGQQQRVAVARALVCDPNVVLADEPTGNLDSHHGDEVMGLLKALNAEGATIVMVTHSADHAANARRIVNLFDGRIVAEHQQAA